MNTPYFYKIGYYSYEDSGYIWLCHEKQFTSAEFDAMVLDVAPEIALRVRTEQISAATKEFLEAGEMASDFILKHRGTVRFEYIYSDIADTMCDKFGFTKAKLQASYSVFGWANVCDPGDWADDRRNDAQLVALTKKITEILAKQGDSNT